MKIKDVTAIARAAFASAVMFVMGAFLSFLGGFATLFAPTPLLSYAVGVPHAEARILAATAVSTVLVATVGGISAATAYAASFGVAAVLMCFMLERRQPFELIVLSTAMPVLLSGTVAALAFAGSPAELVKIAHDQLVAGMMRGEGLYKTLGLQVAIAPDTRAYVVDTVLRLTPALAALICALMVLLNLIVFWRWGGREQRLGYTLFGDLARWSAPEWLVWPLLVSGFAWFLPIRAAANIAMNCFVIVVGIYFCQGLAIMAFYFKQLRMPGVARGLIYFVTLAQPLLMAVVGAAGIFDLWVDFRRLKKPNATARNLRNFL